MIRAIPPRKILKTFRKSEKTAKRFKNYCRKVRSSLRTFLNYKKSEQQVKEVRK